MGSISGSKSKSKNKTTQDIWAGQSPFLSDLYQRGRDLMNNFQQPQQFDMAGAMQAYGQQLQPQMNPYLNAMTAQYTQALGQLDNATGAGAVQAGVFGGGRQGVEQALNQQNIGNQIGNFLGNQYQADQARAMTAISMAPQMQQMQFSPLQNYANLIGAPTVLTSSRGKSKSGSAGLSIGSK